MKKNEYYTDGKTIVIVNHANGLPTIEGWHQIKTGDKVKANVAYKYVPVIKCKVQEIEILELHSNMIRGRNAKGKSVYFTKDDILL